MPRMPKVDDPGEGFHVPGFENGCQLVAWPDLLLGRPDTCWCCSDPPCRCEYLCASAVSDEWSRWMNPSLHAPSTTAEADSSPGPNGYLPSMIPFRKWDTWKWCLTERTHTTAHYTARGGARDGNLERRVEAYRMIGQMGLGYVHRTVNHSRHFRDPVTGVCTNHVEAYWSAVKAKFKAMHVQRPKCFLHTLMSTCGKSGMAERWSWRCAT